MLTRSFVRLARHGCLAALVCTGLVQLSVAADEKPTDLPLSKVVLFSSGVGYYEHNGQITGDGKVELKFDVEDVNDLLKSMVLQDLDGGKVSTVTYAPKDPITRTLRTFAIDLTASPSMADLLRQVRGEKVQISTPNAITGTILGVEHRKRIEKDQLLDTEVLNLVTPTGLRSVPMDSIVEIKLVDAKLNAELQQALDILAQAHATDKKAVTLEFEGAGKRKVRVGYVLESPVWKTSYRLVLKDGAPPFLQGWAVVENTTEQDWNKVSLTLISGRPVSFIQDLYEPLYVARPIVTPEIFASLSPKIYDQDLGAKEAQIKQMAGGPQRPADLGGGGFSGGGFGGFGGLGGQRAPAAGDAGASKTPKVTSVAPVNQPLDPSKGVQSAANAGDVGELFQYEIATPVTLARQKSAMLPIVNEAIKGEKVSIYNEAVQPKHPMNGLKFTNSTKLHLMQGPITVFDGGTYAGDARIEDLSPGSERLISYALDLDTEVAVEAKTNPAELIKLRIKHGTLQATRRLLREAHYVIKNSGAKAKTVLVEQPRDEQWSLVLPKEATQKTRSYYRFAVTAEPGKPSGLDVQEEQAVASQMVIADQSNGLIADYLLAKVASDPVKTALTEVLKRKTALATITEKRTRIRQEIDALDEDQNRIRSNMTQLDRTSELYKRYVKKLTDQEDQLEKLRVQMQALAADEEKQFNSFQAFLNGLDAT